MHRSMLSAVLLLCSAYFASAQAAPKAPPCTGAEHRQFDFWIGRWDVATPDGKPSGKSEVRAIFGGCAIEERWDGEQLIGGSVNAFDPGRRRWHQTWTDDSGRVVLLDGGLEGTRMVLQSEISPGRPFKTRMTYEPLEGGRVRQLVDRSPDGAEWKTVFAAIYTPRKSAEAGPAEIARAYAAAWTANDAEAVLRLFAKDAVLLPAHARDPIAGEAAMRRFWWPTGSKSVRVVSMEVEPEESSALGDAGAVRGRFRLAWRFEGEGEEHRSSGRFLMTLARGSGGEWKITRYMWDDVLPR